MPQNTTKQSAVKADLGLLSAQEVDRLSELIGIEAEWDTTRISRFLLIINHLESLRNDPLQHDLATFSIKQRLFAGTNESSDAQQKFEKSAIDGRGKMLKWPQAV